DAAAIRWHLHLLFSECRGQFAQGEQVLTQSIPSKPTWQCALSTSEQVNSCAISADGSRVVAGTSQEFGRGQFSVVYFDADGKQRWSQPVGTPEAYQGVSGW